MSPNHDSTTISSKTLFHFTNAIEALVGILRDEFRPHYCLEDFTILPDAAPEDPRVAIPMVCFCDIPLSLTKRHLDHYGEFGIGLTKPWGQTRGVSPVLYAYAESSTAVALNAVGKAIRDCSKSAIGSEIGANGLQKLFRLLACVKPYEGHLDRVGEETIRFYDEREWRWVPPLDPVEPGFGYLLETDFEESAKRESANAEVADYPLSFEPNDIRYLIVPSDSDILPLRDQLYEIKEKYDIPTVDLLTTRITTAEQIRGDF